MRTRSLLVLVVVMTVCALSAWVVLADGDGAVMTWLTSLHGAPGGGH